MPTIRTKQDKIHPVTIHDRVVHRERSTLPERVKNEPWAISWVSLVTARPVDYAQYLVSRQQSLRLYREFTIIIAEDEWGNGNYTAAYNHFDTAARTSFGLGDQERATKLLDRADAVRLQIEKKYDTRGNYKDYVLPLQKRVDQAFNDGDINLARDLLKQLLLITDTMGDMVRHDTCKSQLRDIVALYRGKGAPNVTIQRIFRGRLIEALERASIRHALALRTSYKEQSRALHYFMPMLARLSTSVQRM